MSNTCFKAIFFLSLELTFASYTLPVHLSLQLQKCVVLTEWIFSTHIHPHAFVRQMQIQNQKNQLRKIRHTHTPPPVQVWGASHEYSATGFRQRRTHSLGSRRINMHIHTPYCGGGKYTNNKTIIFVMKKHCQRHSGPEGWVSLAK